MESENAIIIALIVIILLVLSVLVFISSNGISLQNDPTAIEEPSSNSVQVNSSSAKNTNNPNADTGISAPTSNEGSDNPNPNADSNLADSTNNEQQQSTADDSADTSESADADSDTPQAGQSETEYDPSDFE